jgi:formate dehydrogenase accessory protein FdhD
MSGKLTDAVRPVDVVRCGTHEPIEDHVAVELPLEVRLNGAPFSVIMRTPGSDRVLALGFLFSEGLIRRREDVERIDDDEAAGVANVVFERSRGDVVAAALAGRRQVTMNSSCGLCGRRTSDSLAVSAAPLVVDWSVDADTPLPGPADCMRQRASTSRGAWRPAPRTSAVTMPWTSCSAACSKTGACR